MTSWGRSRPRATPSFGFAQRLDQLLLRHLRAAADALLLGPLLEVRLAQPGQVAVAIAVAVRVGPDVPAGLCVLERALERRHEIGRRRGLLLRFGDLDLAALALVVDHAPQA